MAPLAALLAPRPMESPPSREGLPLGPGHPGGGPPRSEAIQLDLAALGAGSHDSAGRWGVDVPLPGPRSSGGAPHLLGGEDRLYTGAPEHEEPPFPPAVREFLLELSGAVQRAALYPPGHPSVVSLGTRLATLLDGLAGQGGGLPVAVAGAQFVVDGALSDEGPVLADLARRFRRLGIGAVTFLPGIHPSEFQALLTLLAREEKAREDGRLPAFPIQCPHLRLQPLDYDHLSLVADDAADPGERMALLWRGLAHVALLGATLPLEGAPDPAQVARGIMAHPPEAAYDRALMGYLRRLAVELRGASGSHEAAEMGERLTRLLSELDERTMRRLFRTVDDSDERVRLVVDAGHVLGSEVLLQVLRASLSEEESSLSPSLIRALTKLSLHAQRGVPGIRAPAEDAIRNALTRLLEVGDRSEDPNPAQYSAILDRLARAEVGTGLGLKRDPDGERVRILQMSLETGNWGPMPRLALEVLLDNRVVVPIARLLDATPPGDPVAARIEERLVDPQRIQDLTRGDDLDELALATLVSRLGARAIDPLLDALALAESRSTRRKLFDCLRGIGEQAAIRALQRMDDLRWYVLRNRLALAHGFANLPGQFDPIPFLQHGDPRVRREAVGLAAADPGRRVRALRLALDDSDDRVVQTALVAMGDGVPGELVPVLSRRILDSPAEEGLKLAALRAVGTSRTVDARDVLLRQVVRRGFLRRRLLPPSSVLREALALLSRNWTGSQAVDQVLALARRSPDPSVRRAAGEGGA